MENCTDIEAQDFRFLGRMNQRYRQLLPFSLADYHVARRREHSGQNQVFIPSVGFSEESDYCWISASPIRLKIIVQVKFLKQFRHFSLLARGFDDLKQRVGFNDIKSYGKTK
jgi:hypothetical protein